MSQIRLSGRLVADAVWRITQPGGTPAGLIVLQIEVDGAQLLAIEHIGDDLTRMMAGLRKARSLRRGDEVCVVARGVTFTRGHGLPQLVGVLDVYRATPVPMRHEAAETVPADLAAA